MKRFIYFYFLKDNPDLLREVIASHVSYWKTLRLGQYIGGPFKDKTGGLISFEATGLDTATELVEQDPFVANGLIEKSWVQEWVPESLKC